MGGLSHTAGIALTVDEMGGLTGSEGDLLGWSLMTGDYNGDGCDDLAMGAPGEDLNTGAVYVAEGSGSGLLEISTDRFTRATLGAGSAEVGEQFGYSLASGDFNDDVDDCDDLAIGAPYAMNGAGAAVIANCQDVGTLLSTGVGFEQNAGIGAEDDDHFAMTMAAGDINGDGVDDLVIGTPDEYWSYNAAGVVEYAFGGTSGISGMTHYLLSDQTHLGTRWAGARFGYSLLVTNLDYVSTEELVIGVEGYEEIPGVAELSAVLIADFYPGSTGFKSSYPLTSAPMTALGSHDGFGASLTAGYFGLGYGNSLVAGMVGQDSDGAYSHGAVMIANLD